MSDTKFPLLKYYKSPKVPKVLGNGAFGYVYLFVAKSDCELPSKFSKKVAVKVFTSQKDASFYKEVSLYRRMIVSPHPNIVKFIGECDLKNSEHGDAVAQHGLVMDHYDCDLKYYQDVFRRPFVKKNINESRKVSG
jgi:serine/threonine protein kinase